MPAAEFVRERMLAIARNRAGAPVLADLVPLIERTFRYAYIIATKMHDDMAREGRGEDMEELIADVRELQDSLRSDQSK